MRALFSSVLAGLLLLSATGVQAQTPGFAVGAEDGGVVGVVGADNGRTVPTVTIATNKTHPTNVTFRPKFGRWGVGQVVVGR